MKRYIQHQLSINKFKLSLFLNKFILRHIKPFLIDKEQIPPHNYTKNTEQYKKTEIYPAQKITAHPPFTVNETLQPKFTAEIFELESDSVLEIPNGKIYGQDGLPISPDNIALPGINLIFPPYIRKLTHLEVFSRFQMPELKQVKGNVALMTSLWSNTYYHWMMDVLPKFHMLEKAGIVPDYYVLDMDGKAFQQNAIEKLGIPQEKIIITTTETYIQAESLIIPTMPGNLGYDPKWISDYLKSLFITDFDKNNYPKRLYTSRKKAHLRRFINEDEVLKVLKKYDFTEVVLEDLNLDEQAKYFNSAEIIFAPHGAGLTNLTFSNPGTKLVEIFSPSMPVDCYWIMCNILGIKNYHFMGESPKRKTKINGKKYNEQDIFVNIKKLEKLLGLVFNDAE